MQDLLKVLSGNILAQGIGFLTIIIISRDLGPEQYGIFSLLLAIFTVAIQVSDFGVSTSYVKYVSENLSKAKEIFITTLLSKILLSLVITIILFLFSRFISDFFFATYNYASLIEIVSLSILFHATLNVIVGHFQAKQNFKVFAWLNITHSFLKLLSVVIISFTFAGELHLEYFMLGYSYSVSFIVIIILFKNFSFIKELKLFDFYHFRQIYKLGFWIFLSSLAVIVYMRLDIVMLQKMSSSLQAGYYSAAMNLAMIFPLLINSIISTILPKMDQFLKTHTIKEYSSRILQKTKYLFLLLLFLEIVSHFLIITTFGAQYYNSIAIFQILLIAFIFALIINPISLVFYSCEKAYYLTILNWVQLPLHFLGNFLLIPLFDGVGAALSTVIINLFGGIYIIYIVYSKDKLC